MRKSWSCLLHAALSGGALAGIVVTIVVVLSAAASVAVFGARYLLNRQRKLDAHSDHTDHTKQPADIQDPDVQVQPDEGIEKAKQKNESKYYEPRSSIAALAKKLKKKKK